MSKFVSILKKIGQGALIGAQVVPIYGEVARGIARLTTTTKDDEVIEKGLGVASDGLVAAQNIILNAEAMGAALGVPGADKAKASAPAIHQLFMSLPILKGKKPKDPAVAMEKAQALGGAIADYLNCYED
jgi:hypothetical protein